jgi:hypothetical protein
MEQLSEARRKGYTPHTADMEVESAAASGEWEYVDPHASDGRVVNPQPTRAALTSRFWILGQVLNDRLNRARMIRCCTPIVDFLLISMEDLLEFLSPTTDGFNTPHTHDLRRTSW